MTQDADGFPHCNTEVLHAPGTCWACDLYPNRQHIRKASGTPWTPSEANGWGGNIAQPETPEGYDRYLATHIQVGPKPPPDKSWIEFDNGISKPGGWLERLGLRRRR